ncbi:outer membrane beta-barrel protein [Altererythrobacter salegens]|uniref:Outer membrane beta-barrel protein n=1 Tax=Croceibacterium salegens TaxID=1737568 RepID=A0A6I4SVY1_9SPHN|nr:outer membrane beta-barrel protein [Croceibacterium salegens]MXO59210.1 outer membrane beta-barrel protein [Croceibacterium salegens]
MKKGLALILATASTATAVPAMAQDTGFSGPWVAAVAGYDVNKPGSSQVSGIDPDQDVNAEGLMYGAGVGYDFDMGNLVVGAEGELTDSTADSTYNDPYTDFGLGSVDAGRDLYAGARIGYKLSPTTMLYAKGGYNNARFNFVGSDGTTSYRRHLDTDGYRLGAGIEHKLGTNAFAKVEYRYSNYSKGEIDFEADNIADSDRFDIDTDRHQVVASVGFRF